MSARRHGRREDGDESEINITPMLDIVFIMLIFFMVTTSFVRDPGIDPVRPQAETAVPQARGNIIVAISASDAIWYDGRQIGLGEVRTTIEIALAATPESSVIIVADERASSGLLVDVMDQVRLGGVADVAVAAELP